MTPPTQAEIAAELAAVAWSEAPRVAFVVGKPAPGVHVLSDGADLVEGFGLADDHERKDHWRGRRVEGREVTAIALETLRAMRVGPEVTGDNLVTEGIDLSRLRPGDRLRIGSAVLVRSEAEHRPCALFRSRVGDAAFRAAAAGVRGALFTVAVGGRIAPGDPITIDI